MTAQEKKQMMANISNYANEIIEFDEKDYLICNGGGLAYAVKFSGMLCPTIPNRGQIVSIDTNQMVLLEFEDTLGTTDWLPLEMFTDTIIESVFTSLSRVKHHILKKNQKKLGVHIIFQEYDEFREVIDVYDDFELATKNLWLIRDERVNKCGGFAKVNFVVEDEDNPFYRHEESDGKEFSLWIESYNVTKK